MTKTTTPADAEAWADAQVQRHRRAGWPPDIGAQRSYSLGHLQDLQTLDDAQLAPAEELQAEPQRKPLLSPAGWFWLTYAAGFASALLGAHFFNA